MRMNDEDVAAELYLLFLKLAKDRGVKVQQFADVMRREADTIDSSTLPNIIVLQRWGSLPAC